MGDGLLIRVMYELKRAKHFYLVLFTCAIAFAGLIYFKMNESEVEGVETTATIIGFSTSATQVSLSRGESIFVSARSADGLIGTRKVTADQIAGCRVGDELQAVATGIRLQLRVEPCARQE